MKLDNGQKHLLRLVAKGQECSEGWAPVSKQVYPLVQEIPKELVELLPVDDDGRSKVRLTPTGRNILDAMDWL